MLHFIRKFKIQYRLIITSIAMSIIPVLIISVFSYKTYSESIQSKMLAANRNTLYLMDKNLSLSVETYENFMERLYINSSIQDALRTYPDFSKEEFTHTVNNLVKSDLTYPPYLQSIVITTAEGEILYESGYDLFSQTAIQECCQKIDQAEWNGCWMSKKNYRNDSRIILGARVNDMYKTSHKIGYILLSINERFFKEKVLELNEENNYLDLFILEKDGTVLSSNRDDMQIGESSGLLELSKQAANTQNFININNKDKNYFAISQENNSIHGMLFLMMPHSYVQSELSEIYKQILFLLCIVILVSLIISFVFYRSISIPINNAVIACQNIKQGEYDLQIHDDGHDEVHILIENMNLMLSQLRNVMKKQKENMKRERELEIQMLQYQINPHFLFNTLSTFRWISIIHKLPVLSEMITSLSEILKISLMETKKYIPLEEELQNLQYYIKIQEVRYADKFTYAESHDAASAQILIPKLILQPIVENCILHGTYDNGTVITIEVRAFVEKEALNIWIMDDGKGFDPTTCNFEESKENHHIGIANIRKRLFCIYGDKCTISLTSTPGYGTKCKLILPIDLKNE